MAMTKRAKATSSRSKLIQKELTCASCGKPKDMKMFYQSYNPIHQTGKIPYCKDCLKKMIRDDKGFIDLTKLKSTLKLMDKPFIYDLWYISSVNKHFEAFGSYIKNLAMPQYKDLTWADSEMTPRDPVNNEMAEVKNGYCVSDEIQEFFGYGYSDVEYEAMQKKYEFLKNNYPETTNMHIEALKTYVRYKVKEEFAIANNDVSGAKNWSEMASKAANNAKINPSQLSKADLQGGLSTFGELTKAVEQAVDIIPILPTFKERPSDSPDFTIWCYINYIRDLKGLPLCSYEDIYDFYNKRKKEYAESSSILATESFENDEDSQSEGDS